MEGGGSPSEIRNPNLEALNRSEYRNTNVRQKAVGCQRNSGQRSAISWLPPTSRQAAEIQMTKPQCQGNAKAPMTKQGLSAISYQPVSSHVPPGSRNPNDKAPGTLGAMPPQTPECSGGACPRLPASLRVPMLSGRGNLLCLTIPATAACTTPDSHRGRL